VGEREGTGSEDAMPFVNLRPPEGPEIAVRIKGDHMPRKGDTFIAWDGTRCIVSDVEWRTRTEGESEGDTLTDVFDVTIVLSCEQ